MTNYQEQLLTYAELAEMLSIKLVSAKRLVQRRKWSRIIGNDGVARIRVPSEALPQPVVSDADGNKSSPVDAALALRVAELEGQLEGLNGALEAERRRADAAEARVKDIADDRDAWRQQAQRSIWSKLFRDR